MADSHEWSSAIRAFHSIDGNLMAKLWRHHRQNDEPNSRQAGLLP